MSLTATAAKHYWQLKYIFEIFVCRIVAVSLSKLFTDKPLVLSYELFPPKTEKGETALFQHVERLCEFSPDFITCTYGAGGSTRAKTLQIVSEVKKRFDVPVASHLTLVGSTAGQLKSYLDQAKQMGVDYIVALRGDPPQGEVEFQQTAGGFRYANELVEFIRAEFHDDFSIAVAGYPEKHLEAVSLDIDLENLKRKVDAGADIIITQLFYNNEDFFAFCDRCADLDINIPIVPGILPVTNFKQIQRITNLCGSKLPSDFANALSKNESPDYQHRVGVDFAIRQVNELVENGVPGIHFYVLNKSRATIEVLGQTSFNSQFA